MTSNAETVERYYAAYEESGRSGPEELANQFFHPEVEFSPFLAREVDGRTYRGMVEVRGFFDELEDTFGEISYEDREYRSVDDDIVVMLTRLVGTPRGSAVPVGQELGIVFEFEGGLARHITAFGSHEQAVKAGEERSRAETR